MKHWHKNYPYSHRIYEALPYLYVIVGLVTMFLLRNLLGVVSGLIFVSAGFFVGFWRYRCRRKLIQSLKHVKIPRIYRDETSSPVLAELNWTTAFECGHPVIDAQHRRLFGDCNVLIDMIVRGAPKFEIEWELTELIDHMEDHFCTEENVLAQTKNPLSDDHRQHHSTSLERVKSLRDQYSRSEVDARALVRVVAHELIAGHVLKEDIKWAAVAR